MVNIKAKFNIIFILKILSLFFFLKLHTTTSLNFIITIITKHCLASDVYTKINSQYQNTNILTNNLLCKIFIKHYNELK